MGDGGMTIFNGVDGLGLVDEGVWHMIVYNIHITCCQENTRNV